MSSMTFRSGLVLLGVFAAGLVFAGCGSGSADTYDFCVDALDCDGVDSCLEIMTVDPVTGLTATDGAMCSYLCVASSECEPNNGFAGACMDVDGLGGVCMQECIDSSDCFNTSGCLDYQDATGFARRVCLPDRL